MTGLAASNVQSYWDERYLRQGTLTTTLSGSSASQAQRDYAQRSRFIFEHVPVHLATLDYGCGAGAYAGMFRGPYMGVDICTQLVLDARERHPERTFLHLPLPTLPHGISGFQFDLVFTATVLQHNDDDSVLRIMESFRQHNPAPTWALYENVDDQSATVCGRHPDTYTELIRAAGFPVGGTRTIFHRFHNAEHALLIITPL